MKKRKGFVSNSSSSSFIITNKSGKDLTFVDFIKENPQLIESYSWESYELESVIKSAEIKDEILPANSSDEYMFSDSGINIIDEILCEALHGSGESENFKWGGYERY